LGSWLDGPGGGSDCEEMVLKHSPGIHNCLVTGLSGCDMMISINCRAGYCLIPDTIAAIKPV